MHPYGAETIDRHLAQVDLNKIARSSKFFQRTPQKVTAFAFVKSLCNAACQEIFSYSKVAFLPGLLGGVNISRQEVSDRINHHGVAFIKQVAPFFNEIVSSILFSNALDNEHTGNTLS